MIMKLRNQLYAPNGSKRRGKGEGCKSAKINQASWP
jgi:hypothetical protein